MVYVGTVDEPKKKRTQSNGLEKEQDALLHSDQSNTGGNPETGEQDRIINDNSKKDRRCKAKSGNPKGPRVTMPKSSLFAKKNRQLQYAINYHKERALLPKSKNQELSGALNRMSSRNGLWIL